MSAGPLNRPRLARILLVCCLLGTAAFAGVAGGHAGLNEAEPGNGDRVDATPEELELDFSGDGLQVVDVMVTGPDGDRVDGEAAIESDDGSVVRVPLEGAGDGVYTVEWEVLSDDGHRVTGAYFFVVGDEALDRERILELQTSDDDEDDGVPYTESVAKGLLLVGVVGLLGAPITIAAVVAPATRRYGVTSPVGARRARSLVYGSALLVLGAVTLLAAVRVRGISGGVPGSVATFLGTPLGEVWLVQSALSLATVAAVRYGVRSDSPRRWLGAGVAGGSAVAFTIAWTSHSATLVGRVGGILVDFGHVLGAAVWVGGLLVVAVVVPPYLRTATNDVSPGVAARTTALFSVLALLGVVTVVSTGLLLTAWHVPDFVALRGTTYGAILSAKVGLAFVALGLGGFNRLVLLRRLDPSEWSFPIPGVGRFDLVHTDGGVGSEEAVDHFVTSVRVEVAILVAVLVLTGALTSAPTAAMADGQPEPGELLAESGGVEVAVEPTPSRSMDGTVVLEEAEPVIFDVRFSSDGDPVPAEDGVTLFLRNDDADTTLEFDLERVEPGTYSAIRALPAEGRWELRVEALVDGATVNEWFDVRVGQVDAASDGAAGEGERSLASDNRERSMVGALPAGRSTFSLFAQFSAVLFGILGSVLVVGEARRTSFSSGIREQSVVQQFSGDSSSPPPIVERFAGARAQLRPLQRQFGDAAQNLRGRGLIVAETTRLRLVGVAAAVVDQASDVTTPHPHRPPETEKYASGEAIVEIATAVECGDRVRLSGPGHERHGRLTVVGSEVTRWLDGDGNRQFATARIRLTTWRDGSDDHLVRATTGQDEPPRWRQGDREIPIGRFELLDR